MYYYCSVLRVSNFNRSTQHIRHRSLSRRVCPVSINRMACVKCKMKHHGGTARLIDSCNSVVLYTPQLPVLRRDIRQTKTEKPKKLAWRPLCCMRFHILYILYYRYLRTERRSHCRASLDLGTSDINASSCLKVPAR